MKMGAIGHLATVANNRDDFTCINKTTNFFQQFSIVLEHRDQVPAVLYGNYISSVLCPGCKYNRAISYTLDGFVRLCHNIHTVMSFLHIVVIGNKTSDGSKEKCLSEFAVLATRERNQ